MNARGFDKSGSYFLPDPWCTTEQASPADLRAFHEFVSYSVREYTNVNAQVGRTIYANFLKYMLGHGLGVGTVASIAKQLTNEKFGENRLSWKRVAILDQLQFDVFSHYQKALKPGLSTYFANSTAHLQHAYWRNMDPDSFEIRPSEDDSIYMGCTFHKTVQETSRVVFEGQNRTTNFYDLFCMIDATKSGFHHPDGALWVRSGSHAVHKNSVSVLDIFPTLLQHFDIALPQVKDMAYRGRSLLPLC